MSYIVRHMRLIYICMPSKKRNKNLILINLLRKEFTYEKCSELVRNPGNGFPTRQKILRNNTRMLIAGAANGSAGNGIFPY